MSLSLHLHHTRSSSCRKRWESTHSFSMQMLKVDPLTYKTSKVGFHLSIYIISVVLQILFTLLALLCLYCMCFCILSWHSRKYDPKMKWCNHYPKLNDLLSSVNCVKNKTKHWHIFWSIFKSSNCLVTNILLKYNNSAEHCYLEHNISKSFLYVYSLFFLRNVFFLPWFGLSEFWFRNSIGYASGSFY